MTWPPKLKKRQTIAIAGFATMMTKYAGSRGREHYKHYACEDHAHLIEDTDPDRKQGTQLKVLREHMKNGGRDDYMSEADYQTWGRL